MTATSGDGTSTSLTEAELRTTEVGVRLKLDGGPRWSTAATRGQLPGLRMSLDPGISLRLLRVASVSV